MKGLLATRPQARQALGFDDRLVREVSYPLLIAGIPLLFVEVDGAFPWDTYLPSLLVSALHTVTYWEGNRQIFIAMKLAYPRLDQVWLRLRWQGLAMLGYSLTVACGYHVLCYNWLGHVPTSDTYDLATSLWLGILVTLAVGTFYECAYFFQRWRSSAIEVEQAKLQQVQTQLESLKHQVNPHFLFNSLNTLSSLIPQDPDQAVVFVQRLAQVYRYVLEVNVGETIPLRQELAFIEAYRFLLEARHGPRLQLDLDIPVEYGDRQVVPLALQILVENAVQHNVASQRKPLRVCIAVEGAQLVVRNTLQPKRQPPASTGLGLRNLRTRYQLLTRQAIAVEQHADQFVVRVPLMQRATRESERA